MEWFGTLKGSQWGLRPRTTNHYLHLWTFHTLNKKEVFLILIFIYYLLFFKSMCFSTHRSFGLDVYFIFYFFV